jgi:hypothetical protein
LDAEGGRGPAVAGREAQAVADELAMQRARGDAVSDGAAMPLPTESVCWRSLEPPRPPPEPKRPEPYPLEEEPPKS